MAETECIPYPDTGYFSQLICDYLAQKPELKSFYNRFPTLENFKVQIAEKADFPAEKRELLVSRLKAQYRHLNKPEISTEAVLKNIESLKGTNTFTITTGHQLNVFTGPLYFLYKIISTINLTKKLSSAYPENQFVPVYWMASEDHDFEEINFINLYGGRLRWEVDASGPVGTLPTYGFKPVIDELEEHLGPGTNTGKLIKLFRKAYLEHNNLADATRYIVHDLFGDEGLVIIDGNDAMLKAEMKTFAFGDIVQHIPKKEVDKTTDELEEIHFKQVHPREINHFYIKDRIRERIERKGDKWVVLNTDIIFTEEELKQEFKEHPERFSPNAILRPLYQEVILPNLAYIGGGGELAYWLQLKHMFEAVGIPFPMLVLRNSVLWVNSKSQGKLDDLGLEVKDLFKRLDEIKKNFVVERAEVDTELTPYEKKLQQMFDELEEVANLTDQSMLGAVNAQRQKQLNGLNNLKKKLIRAEKRRQQESMEKIERVYYSLFPKGSLQERHDNLSTWYMAYGDKFIQTLKDSLDPLDFRFAVIYE